MRTLLFYISILLFMAGLVSLIIIGTTPPPWQIWLASSCAIFGVLSAAFLSCVVQDAARAETVPLTRSEAV